MEVNDIVKAILGVIAAGKVEELKQSLEKEKYPGVFQAVEFLAAQPNSKALQGFLAEAMEKPDVLTGLKRNGIIFRDNSGSITINVRGNLAGGDVITTESSTRDYRSLYLKDITTSTCSVALSGLDSEYGNAQCAKSISLMDVYTALDTAEMKEHPETEEQLRKMLKMLYHEEKTRCISVQEMINRESRLVLLGDPGSGKSTLVNYLSFVLAKAALDQTPDIWIKQLQKTGKWKLGPLFPVRIILHEFAATLDKKLKKGTYNLLQDYLKDKIQQAGWSDFWYDFQQGLQEPQVPYLILLDGLDEVPELQRPPVVETIEAFAQKYASHRYLLTCRLYAYIGKDYQLNNFRQVTLMPFNPDQIDCFITAWYQTLRRLGRFTEHEAEQREKKLKLAARRPELIGLAERPLLLTLMAILQIYKQLPEDRVELYRSTVSLMLQRWEARVGGEKGLIETLAIPGLKMNILESAMYKAAFEAHLKSSREREAADISEADLRQILQSSLGGNWEKAGIFLTYVKERAGLLIPHKNGTYTFPHLTFQEYMSACHLANMNPPPIPSPTGTQPPNYIDESVRLLRESPDRWRIVYILSAGFLARTYRSSNALASINRLFPNDIAKVKTPKADDYRLAVIASQALIEMGLVGIKQDDSGIAILQRIQDWLLAAMQADTVLVPKERVEAGNILAELGDPRFDPNNFYLPVEAEDGFIKIEQGMFMMGSDKEKDKEAYNSEMPPHPVKHKTFYIARYPVTTAQFKAFLDDSEYPMEKEWNTYNRVANHPVCNVSWNDAKAYCRWLSDKFHSLGKRFDLPSEAQWERAARGNKEGMIYPWGDTIDPNKANYDQTGIRGTSPVGCFPSGRSSDDLFDMLGNLFEWVEDDWHDDYKIAPDDDQPWVDHPRGAFRVVRGGSWDRVAGGCRSASRGRVTPGNRWGHVGFRLVCLPCQL